MNIEKKYRIEIWIGLAKIQSEEIQLEFKNSKNGYVTVLGLAKNRSEFKIRIKQELSLLNFKLIRLEDAEIFKVRIKKYKVDENILVLAKELTNGDKKIKFSTFHVYN